jgi:hypothetical protein
MTKAFRIMVCVLLASVAATANAEDHAFTAISKHYEAIRQVLMKDSTEGVPGHADAIRRIAADLREDFDPEAAGVDAKDGAAVRALLPEIIEGVGRVASATDLGSVRTELAELTKPLTRYQRLVVGDRPVVAYCSMEKRAWLQPDEPIGNPYAPYMLRCGEVVQR